MRLLKTSTGFRSHQTKAPCKKTSILAKSNRMHRGEQSHRVGLKYWLTANNVLLLCISRQYVNSLRTRFSGSTVKKNPFQASHDVHNNASQHTWEAWEAKMRTNVVIDDDLMESALKLSGLKTKKDANEFSHFFLFH